MYVTIKGRDEYHTKWVNLGRYMKYIHGMIKCILILHIIDSTVHLCPVLVFLVILLLGDKSDPINQTIKCLALPRFRISVPVDLTWCGSISRWTKKKKGTATCSSFLFISWADLPACPIWFELIVSNQTSMLPSCWKIHICSAQMI
jgi:hypothetical protein